MVGVGWSRPLWLGKMVFQNGICQTPPVTNVKLTDIYLPKTLKIEWDGHVDADQFVSRTPGPAVTGTLVNNNGHYTLVDTFDFQIGTTYTYSVTQQDPAGPPPPPPYVGCNPSPSTPVTIPVVPQQINVTDNQVVDARYDLRYSTWTFLDHKFGSTFYRGGLFAGYNADNSQVGHAYLKFPLTPLPAGQHLWPGVGSVNAFYTRMYATGSATIACQSVSPNWDPTTITWSTAPAFTPANATTAQRFTVSYDSANPPASSWAHWTMASDIAAALSAGSTFSAALGGFDEPSTAVNPIGGGATGWAYFSKREYDAAQVPCVLYAYGSPQ